MRVFVAISVLVLLTAPAAAGVLSSSSPAKAGIAKDLSKHIQGLAPTDTVEVIVRFHETPAASERLSLERAGVSLHEHLRTIPAYRATSTVTGIRALLKDTNVAYVERNVPIQFDLAFAARETRARDVWDPIVAKGQVGIEVNGVPIDGSGVAVAVVDSGVDATHPDLPWGTKVVKNFYRTVPTASGTVPDVAEFVDVPNSDLASGHGTHVAGIVGGLGVASDGLHMGAARGAPIYGFGMGAGLSIFSPTDAFDFILRNQGTFNPPIKVVTNSWSSCSHREYDPNAVTEILSTNLVNAGINVVFAMGNIDVDCPDPVGSGYAMNPTPGVLGVANYDGSAQLSRDATVDPSSSEGWPANASTWPDVAAPGTNIEAPLFYSRSYVSFTGTSMAAPHVAGVIAMIRQAAPSLTPGEVEALIKNTAYPYDADIDPAIGHYKKGRGLVDAFKALHALGLGGVNDGVQALSITQATTTPVTRTSTLEAAAGALTVSGDVSFLPVSVNGYGGNVLLYQGGAVEPFVLTDIVTPLPRTSAAGELIEFGIRSLAAFGDVPSPAGLTARFVVKNTATDAVVLDQTSTVACSATECTAYKEWTIPPTTPASHNRVYGYVTAGSTEYLVDSLPFFILGAPTNGLPPTSDTPPSGGNPPPGSGPATVELRYGDLGAWTPATVTGSTWTGSVTVPTVVSGNAVLFVRATLDGRTITDAVSFAPKPDLTVTGDFAGLTTDTFDFALATVPSGYAISWDANYDGTTFDVDGTGPTFSTTYTAGTHTLGVRGLDGNGAGAIRAYAVTATDVIVVLDVLKAQGAAVPVSLATGLLAGEAGVVVDDPQASSYTITVPASYTRLHVTLDWNHYTNPEDPVLGLTFNDFDLWFLAPDATYESHGGATNQHGEVVDIVDPAPGTWRIDVSPFLVAEDDEFHLRVVALSG